MRVKVGKAKFMGFAVVDIKRAIPKAERPQCRKCPGGVLLNGLEESEASVTVGHANHVTWNLVHCGDLFVSLIPRHLAESVTRKRSQDAIFRLRGSLRCPIGQYSDHLLLIVRTTNRPPTNECMWHWLAIRRQNHNIEAQTLKDGSRVTAHNVHENVDAEK